MRFWTPSSRFRRRGRRVLKWLSERVLVPIFVGIAIAVGSGIAIAWFVTRDQAQPSAQTTTTTTTTPPRREPITFTATPDDQTYSDTGFAFVASQEMAKALVDSPHDGPSLLRAAARMGAPQTSPLLLRLLVEANVPRATIIGMRAKVIHRSRPYRGVEQIYPGGGEVRPLGLMFDLDDVNPIARRVRKNGTISGSYFGAGYAITVRRNGEPVRLAIMGTTKRSYVVWEIKALVSVNGKKRVQTIRPGTGQPFRTTASLCNAGGYPMTYLWPLGAGKPRVLRHAGFYPC